MSEEEEEVCPACLGRFKRLMTHFNQNPVCRRGFQAGICIGVDDGGGGRGRHPTGPLPPPPEPGPVEERTTDMLVDEILNARERDHGEEDNEEDIPGQYHEYSSDGPNEDWGKEDEDEETPPTPPPTEPIFIPDRRHTITRTRSSDPLPDAAAVGGGAQGGGDEDSGMQLAQRLVDAVVHRGLQSGEEEELEEDDYDSDMSSVAPTPLPVREEELAAVDNDQASSLQHFVRVEDRGQASSGGHYITDPGNVEVSTYNANQFVETEYFMFRLELAKLVKDTTPRPPNNFVDKILGLIRLHVSQEKGVNLSVKHQRQKTWIRHLRRIFGREVLPEVHKVAIESASYQSLDQYSNRNEYRDTADVTVWNAVQQVKSLLSSVALFGDTANLVVNQPESGSSPFDKYNPPHGRLSEVMSGQWYDVAYADMIERHEKREDITDKKKPFLIPLMFGMDATGVDAYGRYKTEPLLMTLAVIAEHMRNKTAIAWKPLGLMPPLDHKSKNARKREAQGDALSKTCKHGLNSRNYHT